MDRIIKVSRANRSLMLPLVLVLATLISTIYIVLFRNANFNSYFISDWKDTGMDFFNSVAWAGKGNPYSMGTPNYPPMCFLIYKLCCRFVPVSVLKSFGTQQELAFFFRSYMPMQLCYIIITLGALFVICTSIRWILRKQSFLVQSTVVLSVIISGPILFTLERGNIILISLAGVMTFCSLYDSNSKVSRYIAITALAFAASIKLYPAVFALLLLEKRKYREFTLFVLFAALMTGLPFFAFGGLNAVNSMLDGLSISTQQTVDAGLGLNYSLHNFIKILTSLFSVDVNPNGIAISVFALLFCLAAFIISDEIEDRMIALSAMCVLTPSFSYTYTLIMFIPAYIFLLRGNTLNIRLIITGFLIVMILSLQMLPCISLLQELTGETKYELYWGCLIGNLCISVLMISIFVRGILLKISSK